MTTRLGSIFAALTSSLLMAMLVSACDPDYPACENDEHCVEKGEYCVNQTCAQCRDDSHCTGDCRECNNARCDLVVGCCSPSVPCPSPQKCRNGQCGPECLNDAECAQNEKCENGRCVAQPICTVDADCPPNHECVNGICQKITVCQLKKVYFDFDESAIRTSETSTIAANASCIQERALSTVELVGHCDERGTEDYNIRLGERRAKSTRDAMKKEGLDKDLFSTKSRGEYELEVSNARTEAEHQKNRRVEFVIQ